MNIDLQKQNLRREIRNLRKKMPIEDRQEGSRKICDFLLKNLEGVPVGNLFSYMALTEEPDLLSAMQTAKSWGWNVYLPAVTTPPKMEAALWGDPLIKTSLGFFQPEKPSVIAPQSLSVLWIPGVAFDNEGYRLGMGGGFYDRFLERTAGVKVGVGWSFQLLDHIPKESHDDKMDFLVTEQKIHSF